MVKTTKAEVKEAGIRIGINQIVTYATLVPIFLFIAQPLLMDAMAEDIKQLVQQEIRPLNGAFVALLTQNISHLREEVATMEFRRDNPPEDDWTAQDARDLVELKEELEAALAAKAALQVNTS